MEILKKMYHTALFLQQPETCSSKLSRTLLSIFSRWKILQKKKTNNRKFEVLSRKILNDSCSFVAHVHSHSQCELCPFRSGEQQLWSPGQAKQTDSSWGKLNIWPREFPPPGRLMLWSIMCVLSALLWVFPAVSEQNGRHSAQQDARRRGRWSILTLQLHTGSELGPGQLRWRWRDHSCKTNPGIVLRSRNGWFSKQIFDWMHFMECSCKFQHVKCTGLWGTKSAHAGNSLGAMESLKWSAETMVTVG